MARPRTILIVEDEPWLADSYAKALRTAKFRPVCVATAAAAIQAVDETPPKLIILDMMLPRVNGLQLLHELRSYVDLDTVPVIICSNVQLPIKAADLQSYGVARILAKTKLTPASLVRAVREVLA